MTGWFPWDPGCRSAARRSSKSRDRALSLTRFLFQAKSRFHFPTSTRKRERTTRTYESSFPKIFHVNDTHATPRAHCSSHRFFTGSPRVSGPENRGKSKGAPGIGCDSQKQNPEYKPRHHSCQPEMSDHGCIHLNNFKAAKGIQPYKVIHSFFVTSTSNEARIRKVRLFFLSFTILTKKKIQLFCSFKFTILFLSSFFLFYTKLSNVFVYSFLNEY